MSIAIRRATPHDATVISGHRDAMFVEMGTAQEAVAAASGPALTWIAAALRDGRYVGLLASPAGEQVILGGVGVCWLDLPPNTQTTVDRRAYLLNMYVSPEYRGRGLARRLVDEALGVCRESGVTAVSLHASDAGRPLYESPGFVATNEMRLSLG